MKVGRELVYMAYGGFAVVAFAVAALYGVGFVGNVFVPTTVDSGPAGSWIVALAVDVPLMLAFGVQHSVMARPSYKAWWGRHFPAAIERSTYVLVASLLLLLMYGLWRPLPYPVWDVREPTWRAILDCVVLARLDRHRDRRRRDQPTRNGRPAADRRRAARTLG